jgi:hypothetical protein
MDGSISLTSNIKLEKFDCEPDQAPIRADFSTSPAQRPVKKIKAEKAEPIVEPKTEMDCTPPSTSSQTAVKAENNPTSPTASSSAATKTKRTAKVVNKDVCAICLSSFRTQSTGKPNVCAHKFCLECIQEWAKVSVGLNGIGSF